MKDWTVLSSCALFDGISEAQAEHLLGCLSAQIKFYPKGAYLYLAGDESCRPGILLEGKIQLVKEDYFGNCTLIKKLAPSETFGEALVHTKNKTLPANVLAATDCRVLFFDYAKVSTPCERVCSCHTRFLQNLLSVLSEKNKFLTQRIGHITKRSLREKISAYLSEERVKQRSDEVVVPYNRRELAEYLAADRSALSAELSKMQKDGLIEYEKNRFTLKNDRVFPKE